MTMEKGTKWELGFALAVIVLLGVVAVLTIPTDYEVGGVPSSTSLASQDPGDVVQVHVEQLQYVFNISESGSVEGHFYNLIVAHPGQVLNLTMTAPKGATTGNFYFPDYGDQVVDDQIVPLMTAYDALKVPIIPGAYAFLDGEYDGPWYTYQVGLILDIPSSGLFKQEQLSQYYSQTTQARSQGLIGDTYNPPISFYNGSATNVILSADPYGVFNSSIPGPTIVVRNGSQLTVEMYLSTPSPVHSYLLTYVNGYPENVTNASIGLYGVLHNGTLVPLEQSVIRYDQPVQFKIPVNGEFPAYLYGIINPVYNNYDPYNESSTLVGENFGLIMGAWGVILVEG
jgi:terminal oxidase subunit